MPAQWEAWMLKMECLPRNVLSVALIQTRYPVKTVKSIPINNKRRGKRLEADVVELAKARGLNSRRAWGSDGRALGMAETVDLAIEGYRIQCKRKKSLPNYLQIDKENCDAVIVRQDNDVAKILIPFELFIRFLVKEKEDAVQTMDNQRDETPSQSKRCCLE